MTVSAVSSPSPSTPTPPPASPPPSSAPTASSPPSGAAPATKTTAVARAADGDDKVRSAQTSQVKDSDGDYKSLAAAKPATAQSSSAVQAALTSLKKGG